MTSLKKFIANENGARRPSRPPIVRQDAGDASVARSTGLDTASVSLPADIDLEERADRINEFWRALVELQHRDVFVVALCVGEEQKRVSDDAVSAMPPIAAKSCVAANPAKCNREHRDVIRRR